ncbi:phage portal protein [Salipiger sp. PrR003]|uniref:phage portal protein n=1 Tax=Salipiger sp. PrR003 TaxID=2706776 RepID=UPI0013DBE9DC|nr:phage portal protein [Salipiger sp. PrR003]NDV52173.1 phage portal protein [Salipiger sp. PrR003]NDV52199.1 phage portal protein [Salipiger sp. PrR003]
MWLFKRKPQIETKGLAEPGDDLYALFGITPTASTGTPVTPDAALRVPAVGSAIRVISEAVATLDVSIKRIEADGTEVQDAGHQALPLLRDQANDWTDGFSFIRDLVIDALSDDKGGMAYVNRLADGRIAEIIRYRRGVIDVQFDQTTGEPSYKIDGRRVPASDMIHLRSPFGRSPLSLAREAIGVAIALDSHAAKLFGRGARPSGALMFPKGMGEASVKAARTAWKATHEGSDANGQTAILYDGAEFKPFTFNSTDAQFLENRKFQILEIARAFRVPPSMLFDHDRATWSNTEQMGREFLSYTLEPWLRATEGALRRALFTDEERGTHAVRFDRDDLTRADLSTRATVINSLISSRTINPNEGRQWIGLTPREGGDEFLNPNITETQVPAPGAPEDKEDPDAA